jgi:hypothetical protein
LNFDQSDVYALFSRHYFYFAALASLGALQIGVSTGGHRGLWLTPSRALTRAAGVALVLSGAALFFLMPLWVDGPWKAGSVEPDSATRQWGKADWGDIGSARNMNDIDGGLSGTGQATWFPLSAAIAVVISLGAGMVNRKLFPGSYAAPVADDEDGVETIGRLGYAEALKRSWNRFRRDLPGDAAELLAASDRWSITALAWRRWRK